MPWSTDTWGKTVPRQEGGNRIKAAEHGLWPMFNDCFLAWHGATANRDSYCHPAQLTEKELEQGQHDCALKLHCAMAVMVEDRPLLMPQLEMREWSCTFSWWVTPFQIYQFNNRFISSKTVICSFLKQLKNLHHVMQKAENSLCNLLLGPFS